MNFEIFDRFVAEFCMKFEFNNPINTSQLSLLRQSLISVEIWRIFMRENTNSLDNSAVQDKEVSINMKVL